MSKFRGSDQRERNSDHPFTKCDIYFASTGVQVFNDLTSITGWVSGGFTGEFLTNQNREKKLSKETQDLVYSLQQAIGKNGPNEKIRIFYSVTSDQEPGKRYTIAGNSGKIIDDNNRIALGWQFSVTETPDRDRHIGTRRTEEGMLELSNPLSVSFDPRLAYQNPESVSVDANESIVHSRISRIKEITRRYSDQIKQYHDTGIPLLLSVEKHKISFEDAVLLSQILIPQHSGCIYNITSLNKNSSTSFPKGIGVIVAKEEKDIPSINQFLEKIYPQSINSSTSLGVDTTIREKSSDTSSKTTPQPQAINGELKKIFRDMVYSKADNPWNNGGKLLEFYVSSFDRNGNVIMEKPVELGTIVAMDYQKIQYLENPQMVRYCIGMMLLSKNPVEPVLVNFIKNWTENEGRFIKKTTKPGCDYGIKFLEQLEESLHINKGSFNPELLRNFNLKIAECKKLLAVSR